MAGRTRASSNPPVAMRKAARGSPGTVKRFGNRNSCSQAFMRAAENAGKWAGGKDGSGRWALAPCRLRPNLGEIAHFHPAGAVVVGADVVVVAAHIFHARNFAGVQFVQFLALAGG